MMRGCRDRSKHLSDIGVLATSYNTSVGTEVHYRCACEKQRLRGWQTAKCNADKMWEPSDLPSCESDWLAPLSERECVMLGISAACLITLILFITTLMVKQSRKNKQAIISSKRLSDRLKGLKSRDPLEEIIQREVTRRESGEFRRSKSLPQADAALERAKGGRQAFRVWNHDGSQRKKIMAWSLDDLRNEAREKFNLTPPLSFVLELDGKKIHSTEELIDHSGKLLIALEIGQKWRPIRGQHQALNGNNDTGRLSLRRSQSDNVYVVTDSDAGDTPEALNISEGSDPEITVTRSPETPESESDLNLGHQSSSRPAMSVYSIQVPDGVDADQVEDENGSLPAVALMDETLQTKESTHGADATKKLNAMKSNHYVAQENGIAYNSEKL